jgi:hypothetical protein
VVPARGIDAVDRRARGVDVRRRRECHERDEKDLCEDHDYNVPP